MKLEDFEISFWIRNFEFDVNTYFRSVPGCPVEVLIN